MHVQDAGSRPLIPETGDLVWCPRDALQFGIVEAVTATGYLIVRALDGNQTRRVEVTMVDAWFRAFWRRYQDPTELLYRGTAPALPHEDTPPPPALPERSSAAADAAADLVDGPPDPPRRRRR